MTDDDASARILSRRLPGATVLQIVPALNDQPTARAAVSVAAALLQIGARAMVASAPGMLVAQLQALGGEWVQMETTTHNPLRLQRSARRLGELIKAERVDVIHAYGAPAAWSARRAIKDTSTFLVTTYAGAPPARKERGSFYLGALTAGHRIITESGYAADLILKQRNLPADRIVAISPSIDTARFDPSAVSRERIAILRHSWGIRPGWRLALVPGALTPACGQMTAVDAVRILINGGMRGVVVVVAGESEGDDDYARALDMRIEAQGLGGLVRRIEQCPDMPAAYVMADLVIVPCVEPHTFAVAAAEAQVMAKPVIASSVGVLPEIILAPPHVEPDARTGWLVPPAEPVELARAVATALALDDSIRQAIGRRARELAAKRFSARHVAASVLAVYAELLAHGQEQELRSA